MAGPRHGNGVNPPHMGEGGLVLHSAQLDAPARDGEPSVHEGATVGRLREYRFAELTAQDCSVADEFGWHTRSNPQEAVRGVPEGEARATK